MEFQISKPDKPLNSQIFAQENPGCFLYQSGDDFYISGVETQEEANKLLAAHNPPAPKEPTVAEKLASVGLSLDDLKEALGL